MKLPPHIVKLSAWWRGRFAGVMWLFSRAIGRENEGQRTGVSAGEEGQTDCRLVRDRSVRDVM